MYLSKISHIPARNKLISPMALSVIAMVWCCLALATPLRAQPTILVALGDSLTAGYGLQAGQGFVPQLTLKLKQRGIDTTIINAGVSGDTTSGALSRLEWSIPAEADGVIVALGGNDALRAIDPAITAQNLETIISKLQARGQAVFFVGMRAPPNLGTEYTRSFDAIYPTLAQRYGLAYYPFFLEGVAGETELNLPDGIHPNAQGIEKITQSMAPSIEAFVKKLER